MKLNTGYIIADLEMRRSSSHREFGAGDLVFAEGEPASGLFIVLTGKVEIVKATDSGEVKVTEIGPKGVFGEIGLITEDGVRTATARAVETSLVLEVQRNPIQALRDMGEFGGTAQLLKQVICILAEWLRSKNATAVSGDACSGIPEHDAETGGISAAAKVIKSHLPKKFYQRSAPQSSLADGNFLCRQGDRPDGFYFIHSGCLEVLKSDSPESEEHKSGEVRGPTVVGEIAFFSGERRLVSLRAKGDVSYTHFSGDYFEELEEKRPDKALEVLLAAAQSIVALVR
jgi:CRP-like cAMP-binding protein